MTLPSIVTFTAAQHALMEQLKEFEQDSAARLMFVSMPRLYGTTTALVEYVAAWTNRSVIWVTEGQCKSQIRNILKRIPAPHTCSTEARIDELLVDDERIVNVVGIRKFTPERLVEGLNKGPRGRRMTLVESLLFSDELPKRPLLLVVDVPSEYGLNWIPTLDEFTGRPEFAKIFSSIDPPIKTVVVAPITRRRAEYECNFELVESAH
jgi:hypothetical protein